MSSWLDHQIDALDTPVDFNFDSNDMDVLAYYVLLLVSLENFYNTYSNKTVDYVLDHVDEDVAKVQSDMMNATDRLQKQFDESVSDTLMKQGIPQENVKKAKIDKKRINNLVKEQKQTIRNICTELKGQIKSKCYYLKDRLSERLFSVNPNINRAVGRLKKMANHGVKTAKQRGKDEATKFLYGDVYVNWITAHDDKVCSFCLENERMSPFPLTLCPSYPAHPLCGSRCHLEYLTEGKELTDEAKKLKLYDIGGGNNG